MRREKIEILITDAGDRIIVPTEHRTHRGGEPVHRRSDSQRH